MTGHQRKVGKELQRLGPWTFQGLDGKGHAVFKHPEAGRVSVSGSPGDHRDAANTLATAKRKMKQADSSGQRFADYLCRHAKCPRDGELRIEVNGMQGEVRKWLGSGDAENVSDGIKRNPNVAVQAAQRAGRIETIKAGHGKNAHSIFLLRGRDYIPEIEGPLGPDPDTIQDVTINLKQKPVSESNGHSLVPIANLDEVIPELSRWVNRGVRAELHDRDERIEFAMGELQEMRDFGTRVANTCSDLIEILAGRAQPTTEDEPIEVTVGT